MGSQGFAFEKVHCALQHFWEAGECGAKERGTRDTGGGNILRRAPGTLLGPPPKIGHGGNERSGLQGKGTRDRAVREGGSLVFNFDMESHSSTESCEVSRERGV